MRASFLVSAIEKQFLLQNVMHTVVNNLFGEKEQTTSREVYIYAEFFRGSSGTAQRVVTGE